MPQLVLLPMPGQPGAYWGPGQGPGVGSMGAPIPEPGILLVFALAVLALGLVRWGRVR